MSFRLGQIVATPGALEVFYEAEIADCLSRHARGDWGDIDRRDRGANEQALRNDARLLSVYRYEDGRTLWIITEADRSSTCCLLPSEY